MKRQKSNSFSPGSFQTDGRKKKGKALYVCDTKLLPRLRQLLSGHSKGKQPSLDEVVDCLQEKYGEYCRKKKSAFRVSVQKVYQTIKNESAEEQKLQELEERFLGKRKNEADVFPLYMEEDNENGLNMSSDSELTDDEMRVDFHSGNLVNRSMHEMYKTSNSRRNSEDENEESIDTSCTKERTSSVLRNQLVSEEKINISGNLNSKKRNFFKNDLSKATSFSRNGVFKTNDVTESHNINDVTRKQSSGTNDVTRNDNNDVTRNDVFETNDVTRRDISKTNDVTRKEISSGNNDVTRNDVSKTNDVTRKDISKKNDVTRKQNSGNNDATRNDNDVTRNDVSKTSDVNKNVISQTNDVSMKDGSNLNDISRSEGNLGDYNTPENKNKMSRNVTSTRKSSVKRDKKERSEERRKSKNENDFLRDDTDKIPSVPLLRFSDLGGCDECIQEVCKLLIHIKHPEVFKTLGITPPRGFLLHGPPGCGKTILAHAIAGELDVPLVNVASTEVVSGVSGESEGKIRDLFTRASAHAPCVLFLDEIDAITPKRETASKEMERRIVAQLLSCLDDLNRNQEVQVVVIGATNRPDSLDPALRRAGRFDREIRMGIPDEQAREKILHVQCKDLKLSGEFDFQSLARQTPGFVGADLMALAREAAVCAVSRIFHRIENEKTTVDISLLNASKNRNDLEISAEKSHMSIMTWLKSNQTIFSEEELKNLSIEMEDFTKALQEVQPSAKREGFATIPDVTWEDIGALKDIREELTMAIIAPVRHRQAFTELGLTNPPGILLAGPPGCGKTLLAKAIANESGINFISVKGPELLNMYVGESERAVRQVFQRAANSAPCVIFFDELDALCPRRSHGAESNASARVVNQLLTEMDGLETRKQVFIMGATNRPDIIDPAILRPGRLDKVLYVGLPREIDRLAILQTLTKKGTRPRLHEDVDLTTVAADERCRGFSGADLAALVREASVNSLRECMKASAKDSGMTWEPSAAKDSGMARESPAAKDSGLTCQSPAAKDSGLTRQSPAAKDSGMARESPAAKDSGMAYEPAAAAKESGMAWQSSTTNHEKVEEFEKRHATLTGVSMRHFDLAFEKIKPSVSEKEQLIYRYMQERATEKPLS